MPLNLGSVISGALYGPEQKRPARQNGARDEAR
jgi:hypothetical protein